jgi:hypothetical protein
MREDARELITAYHDGELGPDASTEVRRMILNDPEARRYYEALKDSDELLHQAFDPILTKPVPKSIDSAVQRLSRQHHYNRWIPAALAASVALIAILLVRQEYFDRQLHDQFAAMQREIVELRYQTLENTPSGSVATRVLPSGDSRFDVMPVKSYRTADNRYCREYEERITDATGVEIRRGIACRAGKARWPDEPTFSSPEIKF